MRDMHMCILKEKKKQERITDDHVYPSPTIRNIKIEYTEQSSENHLS